MEMKAKVRVAIELLLAFYWLVVGVRQFFLPQFGWPDWTFFGSAIVGLLIALVLVADAIRTGRRSMG